MCIEENVKRHSVIGYDIRELTDEITSLDSLLKEKKIELKKLKEESAVLEQDIGYQLMLDHKDSGINGQYFGNAFVKYRKLPDVVCILDKDKISQDYISLKIKEEKSIDNKKLKADLASGINVDGVELKTQRYAIAFENVIINEEL